MVGVRIAATSAPIGALRYPLPTSRVVTGGEVGVGWRSAPVAAVIYFAPHSTQNLKVKPTIPPSLVRGTDDGL